MDIHQKGRLKPRSLTVATFNANGLMSQLTQVREFVKDHQLDIFVVQETFLKPSMRDPKIANYNIIRNDRLDAPLGGTAIYYRRSLHCVPLDPPPLTNIEASVCHLSLTGHPPLIIVSTYLSPTKSLLKSDIQSLLSLGNSVLLTGDLNSKHPRWNSRVANQRGHDLNRLTDRNGAHFMDFEVIAPLRPTRYPTADGHRPDVLDIAILKGVALQVRSIESLSELASDHRPVLIQLGPDNTRAPETKTVIDWKTLFKRLQSTDPESPHTYIPPHAVASVEGAKEESVKLTSHIQRMIDECSRTVPVHPDGRRELPEAAKDLIRRKNAATRAYDKYPTDANRRRLWDLQRKVKARLADITDEHWNRRLSELTPKHNSYYALARALKNDTVSAMPPLQTPDGSFALEDAHKAECLADGFESQCSPSSLPADPNHLLKVDSEVVRRISLPLKDPPIRPTSTDEVATIIRDQHAKKAPGQDRITNKVLKNLPTHLICLLAVIFNALLAASAFPAQWKEAIVIGFHKPNKPRNRASSYRPISLLNTISKVYERIILVRLKNIIDEKRLLLNEQFGFRTGHSAVDQAYRFTEHVLHSFHHKHGRKPTGALFFDVAKAFDKVWHNGLIYKLYEMGVPDRLVHIIRDFLSNRSFRYRVEGTLSTSRPIRAGVPQGAVLSPTLYSLYTSDIPRYPNVNLALFADDTALYTSSASGKTIHDRLQGAATALSEWFKRWRIEVNPEKSAAMYFNLRPHHYPQPRPITLHGKQIPWQKQTKYLGVTFDNKLTFAPHIKRVRNKAAFVLGRLYPMINAKSRMSLRNKITLYKMCVRPILSYANVCFSYVPNSRLKPLQTIQNRFMRLASGSPWYIRNVDLHRDFELESLSAHFKACSKRYFEKALRHSNPLIVESASYNIKNKIKDRYRRPKSVLTDPDDQTTSDNAPYTTQTHTLHRFRRRRRGPRFVVARRRLGASCTATIPPSQPVAS